MTALRALGIPTFPCWVRYDRERGKWAKGPAVPEGESWLMAAYRPETDPLLDWSSGVEGVPVPQGLVVIDIDTYKGATRADIEKALGVALDWDGAALQRTIGGGEHYAFRATWDVRQGDAIGGLVGFDTRVAGKGFICTGRGYTPVGAGVAAFAAPETLPELPDAARAVLGRRETPAPVAPRPAPVGEVAEALRHIDPGCGRSEWVRVGLALRSHFRDDEEAGRELFRQWSSGDLWPGKPPSNYVAEHIDPQWATFRADGGVTVSTLYYRALVGGWRPVNTAAAFGPASVPAVVFDGLLDRIREQGGNAKHTEAIVGEIKAAGCAPLQVALLAAELKGALKDAGIKDRAVTGHIDELLRPPRTEGADLYGKHDAVNATTFLARHYPDGTLVRCDGELYAYGGKAWAKVPPDLLRHRVALDMAPTRAQSARINSCIDLVGKLAPVYDGVMNKGAATRILFANGVLDLETGVMGEHSKYLYSTILLPYDYSPVAAAPAWMNFLAQVFDGDAERIALLQEWMGYLLSPGYRHHKIMLLLGPKRCGKGTIGRVIHHLVGDTNFTGGSLSSFARDSFLDGLRTKPVLFIGDAAKKVPGGLVNQVIERVKSISGNDAVDFDRKYLSSLSETLPTRITIAANGVPNLFDDSGALAGRMMILPFNRSFYGHEDLGLIDRLLPEMPGIAVWALEGLRRLSQRGAFTVPAASRTEAEQIHEAYSPLTQFLTEKCILGPEQRVTAVELYEAYRAWGADLGEDALRPRVFTGAIKDAARGFGVQYGTHRFEGDKVARGFRGIGVRK